LPKLKGLSLQFNHFTDEGLKHVTHLPGLEKLSVCGKDDEEPNQITDAGLSHLKSLRKLTSLGIQNTHVTPGGIKSFLQAVPGCEITR
jgi:hypothetical protein